MENLSLTQKLLVATAWADGKLGASEARFLRQVLANGSVSVAEIEECLAGPTLDPTEIVQQFTRETIGEEILREVLRMCLADGKLDTAERDLVQRLAEQLGLAGDPLHAIRSQVSQELGLVASS
jgi:uncharacterized tellurite resistance protein B-like protein